jgi:hypothetical protein
MGKWRIYSSVIMLVISMIDTFNSGHAWTFYSGLVVSAALLILAIAEIFRYKKRIVDVKRLT